MGADRELQEALAARYPWVRGAAVATDASPAWPASAAPAVGPSAVDAGECDRCGVEPRLVLTCGPGPHRQLGRRCAAELGVDAWCAGHVAEATAALRALRELPGEADQVARLWWVATGEVRLDPALREQAAAMLPARE